jgi:KDO2-lipid IV(A) lauroyltransferase
MDLFWFARHTNERLTKYVTMTPSSEAMLRAKPAVAVTGHFGNWEILGQAVALVDPPFLAVAAHLKNSSADRLITKLRGGGSQKVAYKEGAMREATNVLDEGGRVGLLLDQNILPRAGGTFVEFFGLPVPMSSAAERLARMKNVPIIFGFCVADDKGYYKLYSPPPMMPSEAGVQDGVITQAIARTLEAEIRRDPGHWLWMYKRWKYVPPGGQIEKYPFYAKPMALRDRSKKQRGTT